MKNCLDPKFSKPFTVSYYFEEVQKVRIAVYDLDNSTPSLGDDDFLGQIECTLGEVKERERVCVYVRERQRQRLRDRERKEIDVGF